MSDAMRQRLIEEASRRAHYPVPSPYSYAGRWCASLLDVLAEDAQLRDEWAKAVWQFQDIPEHSAESAEAVQTTLRRDDGDGQRHGV